MPTAYRYDQTCNHSKVAVFTCTFNIAQTEMTEGMALIKHADKTMSEKKEHLVGGAVPSFLPSFPFSLLPPSFLEQRADIHPYPHPQIIKEIAASNIKVTIISFSISNLTLQYLNCHPIAVLKVASKFELCCVCHVVNMIPLEHVGMPTLEEEGVGVYKMVDFDGACVTVLQQLGPSDLGLKKSGKGGNGRGRPRRRREKGMQMQMQMQMVLMEPKLARQVELYAGTMKGQ